MTLALNNLAHGSIPVDYGASMSGTLITSVPTLAVYVLLGKYFVGSFMVGSVKGWDWPGSFARALRFACSRPALASGCRPRLEDGNRM